MNLALMALAVIAAVPAAGQAGVLLKSARAAGPSCFLGQCARGDRLAELAAALLTVAVVALLAALRPSGVRLPLWTAAASAVLIGAASLALPGETPSLGTAGGAFAVGWGVLFIATGEGEQYLWHRGTPQAPLREFRDHANIVRRANSVEERAAGSS